MLEESIFSDRRVGATDLPPPTATDAPATPVPFLAQRSVDHHPHAPPAAEPTGAGAKVARKAMRRRRRLDRVIGRVAIVVLLAALAGAAYAGYVGFKDQDADSTSDSAAGAADQTNGFAIVGEPAQLTAPLAISAVMPPEITLMARAIDPAEGFVRYIVDADLAVNSQRQQAGDWLREMRGLPQTSAVSRQSIVPDLVSGQMFVAYTTSDGVHVDRLVVLNPDENIVVDAVAP
jgi:hypothetical protein